jgi:dTMP kinase
MAAPLFLALDGIDGTGKSTQCRLLADWLETQGHTVVRCADPGGTPLGDRLRTLVLDERHEMGLWAEAFLFMASRAELVERVIRPALKAGTVVVSDRYLLSNVVYQGHAGGLNPENLWRVGRLATGGLLPHLTLLLDLPVAEAFKRRGRADRMEQRGLDFHDKVRKGFRAEARRHPDRIRLIDARPPVESVHAKIVRVVGRFINEHRLDKRRTDRL